MQAARETMQPSINPPASALVGALDQRQVAGLWMLGATALLIMGAFMPHLVTIFDEIMGIPLEINIGIFGIERCSVGGCESIPLGSLGVGSSSIGTKLVIVVWRAAAVSAIVTSGVAGILALTGKRVRSVWMDVPVGILFWFLLQLFFGFQILLFFHVVEGVVGGSGTGDGEWAMPGISFILLLAGTILASWVQVRDARRGVCTHVPGR